MSGLKDHWQKIHETKHKDVSWWQNPSDLWIDLVLDLQLNSSAGIIDIGAGSSPLIGELHARGFTNLSALDISENAIGKLRSYTEAKDLIAKFIVGDVLDFQSNESFDLWHDRAVFHFLTQIEDQKRYLDSVLTHLKPNGIMVLATFSLDGPEKCSGLDVARHDLASLQRIFGEEFETIDASARTHTTPSGSSQSFTVARFRLR